MAMDTDNKATSGSVPHLSFGEAGLTDDLFKVGIGGRLLFWIAVSFSAFQLVTGFGIPLDRDFDFLPGINLARLAGAALVLGAIKVGWDAVKGRAILEGLLALITLAATYAILVRYAGGLPSQVLRTMHVGFLCLVAALALSASLTAKGGWRLDRWFLWLMGAVGFLAGLYQWHAYHDLVQRSGDLLTQDLVVGVVALATLFVLVWRVLGPALPIMAGIFLAYCLFGNYLPAPLDHRGYDLEQVIEHMVIGTEGIYGTPTLVSATYIFLFILFGSFMERAGVIRFFNEISMAAFGRARGGPGKVCVASSALMGTVSGSGVANVVASGQFTIPLMKRFGFTPAFAGGVEATSSMGGQIMPPVMGAVAFIMAETIDVQYVEIARAAIIPAALYFFASFWSVHLEAGKNSLEGLPREQLPSFVAEVKANWYLILPLLALIYLLFSGFTPLFSGAVALALTIVLILGLAIAIGLPTAQLRVLFWIALGLICAISVALSVAIVALVTIALIVPAALSGRGREALIGCRWALADGARQALPVGLACALVGIIIGTMTLTGLGTLVGNAVVSIGRENLPIALVLVMIFSLILGMGIPTIPNYIITSSLAAPILLHLGVPLIVSHMFVFYFGIMADLTPPVALAAFAAAPMAKESGLKIGIQALRIALPAFIVPYLAVADPVLLLQPVPGLEGPAYWLDAGYVTAKATLAVGLWGVAAFGYANGRVATVERVLAAAAAASLIFPNLMADAVGFALMAGFLAWRFVAARRSGQGDRAAS
ncbi:TRAP transporter permease [Dongia deserti]|uniref:TRAP transporter permease n=1 Tax=Dongia deserti TaxID=2268030 RepID=UPI000E658D70|nr:TRAP transporter fused permease subunit [Dongia deserti]